MDRKKLPLKQKESKYVRTRTIARSKKSTHTKRVAITEQNCSVSKKAIGK